MKKRWIIIILIIIVLFLAFGISIKKTYSSLLVLPEDYRSSMMVDYYDETKVRHSIYYETPYVTVNISGGDANKYTIQMTGDILDAYNDAFGELSKGKYAFESISTKLNANYPNFELIVNSAERKELHLLILNDGTVYQMLDDLHFGNVIRIGSPELVLKYTNGENIYKVLKDAFNAQINQ